ncbi:MAG: hypothetical protein AB7S26_16460 [Sandaracinaceae bacterium]
MSSDAGGRDGGMTASCSDGVRNQDESDVDCGGTCGATCTPGDMCGGNGDCTTNMCMDGVCLALATCSDGTMNGTETDVDCGGSMCDGCAIGEMCAMGSDCASDYCMAGACAMAVCGNGAIESPAEDCDDGTGGTPTETATCDADCTTAMCGDGTVNATASEACDGDGAGTGGETATCDADCSAAMCGDGTINAAAGETCDAGGETAACDVDCTAAMCGDGVRNVTAGEECDDGNTVDTDLCSNTCTFNVASVSITTDATFDTDTGELDGTVDPGWDATSGTWSMADLTIDAAATLTIIGSAPLRILAAGDVDIGGALDVSGHDGGVGECNGFVDITGALVSGFAPGGAGGPGGFAGGAGGWGIITGGTPPVGATVDGSPGMGTGGGGAGTVDESGGGGAGHDGAGRAGSGATPGAGGAAYDGVATLIGGSGGGGGSSDDDAPTGIGDSDDSGGGGGGGGGAVRIEAFGAISISGTLDATGGDGGTVCNGGEGGGGSGGTVVLASGSAPSLSGSVLIEGGVGGFGGGGRGARGQLYLDGTCTDGRVNQDETDVDCGGAICGGCALGESCGAGTDCMSATCLAGACFPATCGNGTMDAGETDVDCGGTMCPACRGGRMCAMDSDCTSAACDPTLMTCIGGGVVLIGHDYFDREPNADQVLTNAVLQAGESGTIEIVVFDAFADNSPTGETENSIAAITDGLTTAGRTATFTRLSTTGPTDLATALTPSVDVLLFVEQEIAGDLTALGASWNADIVAFMNAGGVVISCVFFDNGWQLVNGPGLFTIGTRNDATGDLMSIDMPGHPLVSGVTAYNAPDGSISFPGIVGGVTVISNSTNGEPVVQYLER